MRQKCYLTLATNHVWLISYKLRLSHMVSDVGQIFPTASLHRDHSISYALVCEKILTESTGTGSLDDVKTHHTHTFTSTKLLTRVTVADKLVLVNPF